MSLYASLDSPSSFFALATDESAEESFCLVLCFPSLIDWVASNYETRAVLVRRAYVSLMTVILNPDCFIVLVLPSVPRILLCFGAFCIVALTVDW